ncbi:hypothetical protein Clacol_009699, partial [Clathrus columnatus]
MSTIPAEIQAVQTELTSDVLNATYGIYNLCAVVAVLAFDILETLNNEVSTSDTDLIWETPYRCLTPLINEMNYIWKKKLGIITLLYVVSRYVPLLMNVAFVIWTFRNHLDTFDSRREMTLFYCIPWFVVLACTEYLFILRAVALNGHLRWLHYTLTALFIGEMIGALVLFVVLLRLLIPKPSQVNPVVITLQPLRIAPPAPPLSHFGFSTSVGLFGVLELSFQTILVV